MLQQLKGRVRNRGLTLILAQFSWGVMVLAILGVYALFVVADFTKPFTVCNSGCSMTPDEAASWAAAGVDPSLGELYEELLYNVLVPSGFVLVAALIAWRKSADYMGLLVSIALIGLGCYLFPGVGPSLSTRPGWQLLTLLFLPCTFLAFAALFYLFPDGRFAPRWTRWVLFGYVLIWFGASVLNASERLTGTYELNSPADIIEIVVTFPVILLGLATQVFRYVRVSGAIERQQSKWVIFRYRHHYSPHTDLLGANRRPRGILSWQRDDHAVFAFVGERAAVGHSHHCLYARNGGVVQSPAAPRPGGDRSPLLPEQIRRTEGHSRVWLEVAR